MLPDDPLHAIANDLVFTKIMYLEGFMSETDLDVEQRTSLRLFLISTIELALDLGYKEGVANWTKSNERLPCDQLWFENRHALDPCHMCGEAWGEHKTGTKR